ncbi:Murein hydrolase activator NlpD precursor [Labrenzia sp. THAF82]|nr:Murein hydrolase activator NlpD precursor [Labrenzia sp. THAF82]
MKKRMRTLRGDLLSKVATVSLLAAVLAGCSGAVERFGEPPFYTGNTQNQRNILNGGQKQPTYQDIVNGPGGTSAGLPQSNTAPATTGSIPQRTSQISSAPLPAPAQSGSQPIKPAPIAVKPAPEISSAPVVSAAAGQAKSWKGWTSTGGTRVQVRQGDSVQSMARRFGVPEKAIMSVNGISDPNQVRPGQSIIIPTYVYSERNGSSSVSADKVRLPKAGSNERVVTGSVPTAVAGMPKPDRKPFSQPTFADISRGETVVEEVEILRVSTLPKKKPSGFGQSLTTASIKSNTADGVPSPRRQPGSGAVTPTPVAAAPSGTVDKNSLPAPALTDEARPTAPIKTPTQVASVRPDANVSSEKFRWPVRGRIISDFGSKPGGGKNEGVNLAVPEGTPVKAADGGTVIYSGNELKGYGNLVLVRHDEGWVSAYAHNSELKVKRGDTVRRGDVVGLAGKTGSVNQPQVHFELRKGNKPVDPLNHLPRR